jgi:hypothetical protein
MSMTIAESSALEFEPWTEEEAGGKDMPMTAAQWNGMLITTRLAWAAVFRSKPELIRGIASQEDAFMDLIEAVGDVKDTLKGLEELLGTVEMRLLASAAAHCQAEGSGAGSPA